MKGEISYLSEAIRKGLYIHVISFSFSFRVWLRWYVARTTMGKPNLSKTAI